jgi:soluble lytic murein transglycosylase-like protein
LWYHLNIEQNTRRRLALTAFWALTAAAAVGQEPRLPAAEHGLPPMAFPSRAMVAAPRLSELYAGAHPSLAAGGGPEASRLHQQLVVPVPVETAAYRHTFRALLAAPDKTDRYDELIFKYARRNRLDARFVKSIMAAESEFDPNAVSPSGARGLMQVMPRTSDMLGVPSAKLRDPEGGIKAGTAYLQELFRTAWKDYHLEGVRYTDAPPWVLQRVVAAYHSGPKALRSRRWYASTRAYVRKVVLYYNSNVTDLRRPRAAARSLPSFADTLAPSGTLY